MVVSTRTKRTQIIYKYTVQYTIYFVVEVSQWLRV